MDKEIIINLRSINIDINFIDLFLLKLIKSFKSRNNKYIVESDYSYNNTDIFYYDREWKNCYFDTINPNRYIKKDLSEAFYPANEKQIEKYKKELIYIELNLFNEYWFKAYKKSLFTNIKLDIVSKQEYLINWSIKHYLEISSDMFDKFIKQRKQYYVKQIEESDYSYDKLLIKVKYLLEDVVQEKWKIRFSLSNLDNIDLNKELFINSILLLVIENYIEISWQWEVLEIVFIKQSNQLNKANKDNLEENLNKVYETLNNLFYDETCKEISLKKGGDWKINMIEWVRNIDKDSSRYVDIKNKYPFSNIEGIVYKWKTLKYKVTEKIKLENDRK